MQLGDLTEGRKESNRRPFGPGHAHPRHTQNVREPHVSRGKQKWKRPTEKGWALNFGGGVARQTELISTVGYYCSGSTRKFVGF